MFTFLTRRLTIASIMIVVALALVNGLSHSEPSSKNGSYLLQAPAFVNAAQAAANASGGFVFQNEAGSAAYCQNTNGIVLSDELADLYQVIENLDTYETDGYMIGRMDVPGIDELDEPRIYIDTNGWAVAFFSNEEPLGYMLDTLAYGSNNPTFPFWLDNALEHLAANFIIANDCKSYYDFRYPNATQMTIVGELGVSTFEIQVPDTYQLYRSGVSSRANVYLNGNPLVEGQGIKNRDFTMSTGTLHEFRTVGGSGRETAVILLYSEE